MKRIPLILGLFLGITVVQADVGDDKTFKSDKTLKSDKTFKLVTTPQSYFSYGNGLDSDDIYFDNEAAKNVLKKASQNLEIEKEKKYKKASFKPSSNPFFKNDKDRYEYSKNIFSHITIDYKPVQKSDLFYYLKAKDAFDDNQNELLASINTYLNPLSDFKKEKLNFLEESEVVKDSFLVKKLKTLATFDRLDLIESYKHDLTGISLQSTVDQIALDQAFYELRTRFNEMSITG